MSRYRLDLPYSLCDNFFYSSIGIEHNFKLAWSKSNYNDLIKIKFIFFYIQGLLKGLDFKLLEN